MRSSCIWTDTERNVGKPLWGLGVLALRFGWFGEKNPPYTLSHMRRTACHEPCSSRCTLSYIPQFKNDLLILSLINGLTDNTLFH